MERLAHETKDKAIQDMLERHTKVSMVFQNKVIEGLKNLKSETLTASDLIRIFSESVKIERLSRGVADVVDEVRLNQAQAKLELEKAKADMGDKKLEESSGFIEGIQNLGKDVWADEDKLDELTQNS
jgi:hypothetical protein